MLFMLRQPILVLSLQNVGDHQIVSTSKHVRFHVTFSSIL